MAGLGDLARADIQPVPPAHSVELRRSEPGHRAKRVSVPMTRRRCQQRRGFSCLQREQIIMPNTEPPCLFAVTTPGLSATRWLAYVLASHPDVFVAHGKHALDAVIRGDFRKEKGTANHMSLESGNDMWEFYQERTLEEVFARDRQIKPEARTFRGGHSDTIDALSQP